MSFTRVSSALLLSLGLAACDGTPPQPDAGNPVPDAGPPDAGPPLACTDPTPLDAVRGDTVSVMFNTSMTETRPRDLGLQCGNVEAELRWAPQEVVALSVPGTGPVAVELDTVFEGDTDMDFNTVLQVRTTCEQVPQGIFPPTCFDDVSQTEFRSRGSFMANGGETYYVIVTGYSRPPAEQGTVDHGRVRLDVTLRENSPPTVTSNSPFWLALHDVVADVSGNDPDDPAMGVAMNFYDASGLLDIYGDGQATEDGDAFIAFFDPAPTTGDFDARVMVLGAIQANLATYLRNVRATRARLRVFDTAYAQSEPIDVDIREAATGLGESCDSDHLCRPQMSCVSGICAAAGAVGSACTGAIHLDVQPDGVPVTRTGSTGAGVGRFAPSVDCVADPAGALGAEAVYSVTVPDGVTANLTATTALAGTGSTDTILYLRSACADWGAELDCNDDRGGSDRRSAISASHLGPGTYYLFVEEYGGRGSGSAPHALQVTLTQVGTADGGMPDLDGGVPDGGPADGGVPDGGVPDGGVFDGGTFDGGPDAS